MAVDFRPKDRIVVIGDSITIGSNGPSWFQPLAMTVKTYYTRSLPQSSPGPMGRYEAKGVTGYDIGAPTFFNLGVAGQTTTNLVARLAEIYALNPTGVIIAYQTNDCDNNTVPNATFTTNVTTAIPALQTASNYPNGIAPRWIAWQECACFEEQRWTENPYDTTLGGLADKDLILRTQSVALGFTLIETRTDANGNGPWNTYELANNPGDLNLGILTIDGRHLNQTGAVWQSALFMQSVTLVG